MLGVDATWAHLSAKSVLQLARSVPGLLTAERRVKVLHELTGVSIEYGGPLVEELLTSTPTTERDAMFESVFESLTTSSTSSNFSSSYSVAALASYNPRLLPRAVTAVRESKSTWKRAKALVTLSGVASDGLRRELLLEAWAAANTIDDARDVAASVAGIVGELEESARALVLRRAMDSGAWSALAAHPGLVSYMSDQQVQETFEEVLSDDHIPIHLLDALAHRVGSSTLRNMLDDSTVERTAKERYKLLLSLSYLDTSEAVALEAKNAHHDALSNDERADLGYSLVRCGPPRLRKLLFDDALRSIERAAEELIQRGRRLRHRCR